jgi:plastocyanin
MHIRTRTVRLGAIGAGAVVALAACTPAAGGTVTRSPAPPAGVVSGHTPAVARSAAGAARHEVRIVNGTFIPATLTIRAGQMVLWVDVDPETHTVDLSGIVSNVLHQGDTYTLTFTAPGTYPYTCSLHPQMHGTIVVTA